MIDFFLFIPLLKCNRNGLLEWKTLCFFVGNLLATTVHLPCFWNKELRFKCIGYWPHRLFDYRSKWTGCPTWPFLLEESDDLTKTYQSNTTKVNRICLPIPILGLLIHFILMACKVFRWIHKLYWSSSITATFSFQCKLSIFNYLKSVTNNNFHPALHFKINCMRVTL